MICLYIDTSSDYLYSAIINDQKIAAEIKEKYAKDLSVEALPQIIKLFDKSNLTPKDLDKIIVVNGPGSFTGIRIGITIAKTMAWSLKIPIVPISGLKAMAISVKDKYKMPLIDARRGFVYGAIYDENNNAIVDDIHIKLDSLLEQAKDLDDIVAISNNEFALNLKIEKYIPDILTIVNYYKNTKGINPHLVNPIYLKKTEAEEKLTEFGEKVTND